MAFLGTSKSQNEQKKCSNWRSRPQMILYGGSPSNLYGRLCFGCCKLSWMITAIPFEQSRCRSINSFSDYSPRRKSNQSSGVPPTVTHRIPEDSSSGSPFLASSVHFGAQVRNAFADGLVWACTKLWLWPGLSRQRLQRRDSSAP